MRRLLVLLVAGLALAQPAPIPPPRQPEEPKGAGITIEIQVQIQNKPAEGLIATLGRRGPEGRPIATNVRPALQVTDARGVVLWSGLPDGIWVVNLRDPRSGFAISLPVQLEFLNQTIRVGPYTVQLFMAMP
ncbi:hypothetical protein [Meiothermus sp. CFH 77666]|uniref:hypothetical protein n=1 Tax=Meiothermus sp. CFH 77666 TaxID=2817942 RepID=UPI001AA04C2B|nr:hypothetical protein [Meiothermus sp. CFH 77666]MBO1436516.1 hypothetical protein [Meiothermus sp. CFH 77666]